MFAICLDFPYEHQIKKIYKDIIYKVSTKIEMLARENGCIQTSEDGARFYFFDDDRIAANFLVVHFLHCLSFTLEQVSSKIHEYRIIVELFAREQRSEDVMLALLSLKDSTFLYNKVCVGSRACRLFKKYLSYSNTKHSSLSVVEKFTVFDKVHLPSANVLSAKSVPVFVKGGQSYIMALSNFILMTQFSESELQQFSASEKKTYKETQSVFNFFSKNRFKERIEKYFVDAFISHAGLHAKMYRKLHGLSFIDVYVDKADKTLEAEKVRKIIGEVNIINSKMQNVNIEGVPEDLLELIYILIYSLRFIFVDEAASFFFCVTRSTSYDAVLALMHKLGMLSKEEMLHSYKEQVLKQLEKKLKGKKTSLNTYIAQFLLDKYKDAQLCADIQLKSILDALKCEYQNVPEKTQDKNLIVDIFFNSRGNYLPTQRAENVNAEMFQNIAALNKYEEVASLHARGEVAAAISLAKELNTYFNKNRILSGEYKTFIFLSFLHLKNNNINDAQTYCVYALEVAKKTKNDRFICEAKYFLSLVYFLRKDFCNALDTLQELSSIVYSTFQQEWKVYYLFLEGRIYLEMGDACRASSAFSCAKDFAHRYFPSLLSACNVWYGRACLYAGNNEEAIKVLKEENNMEASLFLLEAAILFPNLAASLEKEVAKAKREYDSLFEEGAKKSFVGKESIVYSAFEYMEDVAWQSLYKTTYAKRLFDCFYSYYKICIEGETSSPEKIAYLASLKETAMQSLYAKDANAYLYLYLCYAAQCAVDGKTSGEALSFLSKACSVLQRVCTLLHAISMRDAFMKENVWNAKLSNAARENKLL